MKKNAVLRILDANFNRSREGLRVCEEIARFFMEEPRLTDRIKRCRHRISKQMAVLPVTWSQLLSSRDSRWDVGRNAKSFEKKRRTLADVFLANAQRVKESLRVLEEFLKIIDPRSARALGRIRFEFYETEKNARLGLAALCHYGCRSVWQASSRGSRRGGDTRRGRRHSNEG